MEKDGWRFVGPFGAIAVVLLSWGGTGASAALVVTGGLFAVTTAFLAFFFRDPERRPPEGRGLIVSPADGRVVQVTAEPNGTRVAVFLSVFDVHVNRAPVAGRVTRIEVRRGRFWKAYDPRASAENEQTVISVHSPERMVEFALIAGVLARRVVCRLTTGRELRLGERIGLIRFGSRAEVLVPPGAAVLVRPGDRVRAGETPLARFAGDGTNA